MNYNPELIYIAINRFDQANAQDPNKEEYEGIYYPTELLYAKRMTKWLEILNPKASDPLKLAVRAQHIRRWEIPREKYPKDRRGYLQWRTALAKHHAALAEKNLKEVGFDAGFIAEVKSLIKKENLKKNPETQTLEDAACLVFLENYMTDFSTKHDEEKLKRIVVKTWGKMSERGQAEAKKLHLPEDIKM